MLCFVFGFAILIANSVDIAWTALGTHGGGPVSTPITDGVWHLFRFIHRHRPNHRLLSFAGSAIIVVLLAWWVSLIWIGWFLVFSAKPDSIVDAHTHVAPHWSGRLFFTAYAISTMGNGDFVPNGHAWRILTSIATLGGLGTFSMTITFLMNVLPAVVVTRSLGSYLSDLGGTPQKIFTRSWDGINFDSLNDHLLSLTGMIHMYTEQHLAYPVLQYFHSEHERTSASLRLAALNEIILLLCYGVAESVRPSPMVILPVKDALNGLARVVEGKFIEPADDPPPNTPLSLLRDLGIPTVDDAAFAKGLDECERSRKFFAGLLENDGWPWERIWEEKRVPAGD